MTITGGIFDEWLLKSTLIELGLESSPQNLQFMLGVDSNWNSQSSKIDAIGSEINEENGYSRYQLTLSKSDFTKSSINKRVELIEKKSWDLSAIGLSIQWNSFAVLVDAHDRANTVLENINPSTNFFSLTAHELSDGDEILITPDPSSTLPSGLLATTLYFVINSDSDNFQISETSGGSPIALSDSGSGDIRLRYANGALMEGWFDTDTHTIIANGEPQRFYWDYKKINTNLLTGTNW